jgi:hypothetical protein
MAYDEKLAARIRRRIGLQADVSEKKMFGGLAFLIRGNMAIAASGQGGIPVRVDPSSTLELVADSAAHVAAMRGREMPGWLRVGSKDLSNAAELNTWIERGVSYARSLPAK